MSEELIARLRETDPYDSADVVGRAMLAAAAALESYAAREKALVQAVAMALCKASGQSPDDLVQAGDPIGNPADYPAWMLWLPEARTTLQSLAKAPGGGEG